MKSIILFFLLTVKIYAQTDSSNDLDLLCNLHKQGNYELFAENFTKNLSKEIEDKTSKTILNTINVATFNKKIALKKHCESYDQSASKFIILSHVIDIENVFTEDDFHSYRKEIESIRKNGLEVILITVSSYYPYNNKEDFAYDVLLENKSNLTDKGSLVILISNTEKEIRITTDDQSKEFITDDEAENIVQNILLPNFRNQNFSLGINQALTRLKNLVDQN